MENQNKKIPAIYVESAYCYGSGSQHLRGVSGISLKQRKQIEKMQQNNPELVVLVDSNTHYLGQKYKLAEYAGRHGWNKFQIDDKDYEIIHRI